MGLETCTILASTQWKDVKANTGFDNTYQGPSTKAVTISPSVSTYNRCFRARYTISAAATQTVDFYSFTDHLGVAVTMTKILSLEVIPTGSGVIIADGASNPLTWFLGGTTPTITLTAGGVFLYARTAGYTVDATHRNLKFTETGGSTLTLDVVAIGGD